MMGRHAPSINSCGEQLALRSSSATLRRPLTTAVTPLSNLRTDFIIVSEDTTSLVLHGYHIRPKV